MDDRLSGLFLAPQPVRFVRLAAHRPLLRAGGLETTRSDQTRSMQAAVRASARPGRLSESPRFVLNDSWAKRSKRFRHRLASAVQSQARDCECGSNGLLRSPPAYIATSP